MVVALRTPGDPANIPHDVENQGVATGIDQQPNPQISGPFGLRRRSRIRLGALSQGGDTGSNPVGTTRSEHVSESRDCPWPRIGPAACTEPSPVRIPCRVASVLTASGPSSPFLQDGKEGQRAGFPAIFLVALSARRRVTMRCLHVVDGSGATAASARATSNV